MPVMKAAEYEALPAGLWAILKAAVAVSVGMVPTPLGAP